MKRALLKPFSVLLLVSVLGACGSKNDTVAEVGDETVSKQQFEAYLQFKNIPKDDTEKYQRALDVYLERAALSAAISESGKLDQTVLAAELEEFKTQLLISRYFENFLKDAASEDAIRNYYSNNADEFESTKAHVAHILIRVNKGMDESERQRLLTTAHEIYSKLQSGEDFAALAREHSDDKISAEKGGDLGWLNKGAVSPDFSDKAFSLNEGEFSEPFLTDFGFHILKVLEKPQVVKQPLEAVKGDIRYRLRNEAKQAEKERLMKTITVSRNQA